MGSFPISEFVSVAGKVCVLPLKLCHDFLAPGAFLLLPQMRFAFTPGGEYNGGSTQSLQSRSIYLAPSW